MLLDMGYSLFGDLDVGDVFMDLSHDVGVKIDETTALVFPKCFLYTYKNDDKVLWYENATLVLVPGEKE